LSAEPQQELGSTANSYAILAKLATGGMAELFLARNASGAGIERYVVLKRVLSHRTNDERFVRMFLDEARLAAQLQHPNIAQVYDTGVLGESYFFTMEYVHGETVRELMLRAQADTLDIPIGCALTIVAGAAAGLHHAHERIGMDGKPLHIVHRDVSPSNLMVSYEGQLKLVDFGVAKATMRSSETNAGTVKGKISYLSPEQCRGRATDRRSDLFALGIVMWELLAGERLFQRDTDYDSMDAIVKQSPPSLIARRPDVPVEVEAIVSKLLAKDPAERFQTAGELLEAIEGTAVQTSLSLSVASLARFMRELFGQRPEPWIQMRARDEHADAVTVTASPLVSWPARADDVTSSRLALVPDLSIRTDWPKAPAGPSALPSNARSVGDAPRSRRGVWFALALLAAAAAGMGIFAFARSTENRSVSAGAGSAAAAAAGSAPGVGSAPVAGLAAAPAVDSAAATLAGSAAAPAADSGAELASGSAVAGGLAGAAESADPVASPPARHRPHAAPKLHPPKRITAPASSPAKPSPSPATDCDADPMACRR
jgi:serine/threonine-protein kinase